MIDLTNLRFFYHTARNMSFTAAASELCVTQPSVTRRVQALEEECMLNLFGKERGRAFLSEEGKVLFKYAKKIFDYEKQAEKAISDIMALNRGFLRIGLPSTPAPNLITFLIDTYHKKYPNIKIQVTEGNSTMLIKSLLNHQNEIVLGTARMEEHPDIHLVADFRERLSLVVCPTHRFAGSTTLPVTELAEEPIILRETGSATRKIVMELFERNQCEPNILFESSNAKSIKQMVKRGDGISFLLKESVSPEIDEGSLVEVPIEGGEIFLDLYVAYLKNIPLSAAAKGYLDLMGRRRDKQQSVKD